MSTEMIKIWKDLNIHRCEMQFFCGGDSMGDTIFTFYDTLNNSIGSSELEDYFENEVYNHVEFYVNSDEHYIGEEGIVKITLDGDEFKYIKDAQSGWSENISNILKIKLTPEMVKFIKDNVSNINGGEGDSIVNFSKDLILSDNDSKVLENIKATIGGVAEEFCPTVDGNLDEWYTFTTNEDGEDIEIINDELSLQMENSYTTYTDSE